MEGVTRKNFVSRLLQAVPEFHEVYHDEIEANRDLPYTIVDDLLAYVLALFSRNLIEEGGPFRRALQFLEQANQTSILEITDIISCSFLENVQHAGKDYFRFRDFLGPSLRRDLALIDGENPEFGE